MAALTRGNVSAAKAAGSIKRRSATARHKPSAEDAVKPEVRIFLSYSHQDAGARKKLYTHLAPWRRDRVIVYCDENIEPGAGLDADIARELRHAHIFVALFSPSYLDSNYCWNIEYKRAMSRRARKLMRVVAVVVKPCGWRQTRAARFKLLPKDGVPPERWSSTDAAFVDVAQGIGKVIKSVRRELAAKPPELFHAKAKPKPKPKPPKSAPNRLYTAGTTSTAKPAKPRAPSRMVNMTR